MGCAWSCTPPPRHAEGHSLAGLAALPAGHDPSRWLAKAIEEDGFFPGLASHPMCRGAAIGAHQMAGLWANYAECMSYAPEDVEKGRRIAIEVVSTCVPVEERAAALAAIGPQALARASGDAARE